ncbi:MAG: hypothetical protein WBO70_06600 [Erysipelotrichaceae bacterium]
MERQVLAAITFNDNNVVLMIGEFFNARLNILRCEKQNIKPLSNGVLADTDEIVRVLRQMLNNVYNDLGMKVKNVLLNIPSYGVEKRVVTKSKLVNGIISKNDIFDLYDNSVVYEIDDLALVNAVCNSYEVNGLVTKKAPINEKTSILKMEMELFYAHKDMVYSYMYLMENLGLNIIDVSLDNYSFCKEASLFEKSFDKLAILINLGYNDTNLVLLNKGKIESVEKIDKGFRDFESQLKKEYDIPEYMYEQVVSYSLDLLNEQDKDVIIYVDNTKEAIKEITIKDIDNALKGVIDQWISEISNCCGEIIQQYDVNFYLGGYAVNINNLDRYISIKLQAPCNNYISETFGGRSQDLVSSLGVFYAYHDNMNLVGSKDSVDISEYSENLKDSRANKTEFINRFKAIVGIK